MNTLLVIIIATVLVSLVSLVGVFLLAMKEKVLSKSMLFLVALSAGALLGGALLHLLPEAILGMGIDEGGVLNVFAFFILGFCVFFVLEQFLGWHHCHKHSKGEYCSKSNLPILILVSDSIHNLIDGIIIAASFLISIPVGIASMVAVVLHEIPQEMGDFGVLLYGGMKKKKAIFFNFLSALAAVLGGVLGYFALANLERYLPYILAFMAGHFVYISASDLIPEIKEEYRKGVLHSLAHFSTFLLGIILMLILRLAD